MSSVRQCRLCRIIDEGTNRDEVRLIAKPLLGNKTTRVALHTYSVDKASTVWWGQRSQLFYSNITALDTNPTTQTNRTTLCPISQQNGTGQPCCINMLAIHVLMRSPHISYSYTVLCLVHNAGQAPGQCPRAPLNIGRRS